MKPLLKTFYFQMACLLLVSLHTTNAFAQTIPVQTFTSAQAPAYVDFDAYENLVAEVKEHRKTHMLTTTAFKQMSQEEKVIVLDTRSDSMFNVVHIKGAVHLNFSDFTQQNLAKIIPSPDYKILIYCNNNFNTTQVNTAVFQNPVLFTRAMETKAAYRPAPVKLHPVKKFTPKTAQPKTMRAPLKKGPYAGDQRYEQDETDEPNLPTAKPLTLALNIPTYINLYGYGYRNVYELAELVNTYDHIIEFAGTAVAK